MDFRHRHKVDQGCNWLTVSVAVGWIASISAGLSSPPSDPQTLWLPPPVVQRALPADSEPAPTWGPGATGAQGSNRNTDSQSRAAASSAASAPATDPTSVWGDAPYVVAPTGPVPPITPVHPLLGPDF